MSTTSKLRGSKSLGFLALATCTLLGACKASPCSDSGVDLPPHLAKLPVVDAESSVCIAITKEEGEESAMVMRWGEDFAPVETKLMTEMDAAGWGQAQCWLVGGEKPDEFCFEKGQEFVRATFEHGESKSLGINKPAIITHLSWYEKND